MTGSLGRLSVARVVLAGVGLAGVVLAGCDSSDGPGQLPTGSPISPPSTASPTASTPATAVPTPPPEAREHTSAGASEFVRFYIGLINEAYRSGASEPLRAYADPECDSCSSIADAVDEIYATGSARGGLLTIDRLTSSDVAPGLVPSVVLGLTISPFQRLSAAGDVIESDPASTETWFMSLSWTESAWRVVSVRHAQG